MTNSHAIARYAALIRRDSRSLVASNLRAPEWQSCGGEGPLKHVAEAVIAEAARQNTVSRSRPRGYTSDPRAALNHAKNVLALLRARAIPAQRGKLGLRIHPAAALIQVASPHKRCTVYRREFAGHVLGFVAVRRGAHYHDSTADRACAGVTQKIARARLRAIAGTGLDMGKPLGALLRGLGFCPDGTADALAILGLRDREYDPAELLSAGDWSELPRVARKYPWEVAEVVKVIAQRSDLVARLPESMRRLIG